MNSPRIQILKTFTLSLIPLVVYFIIDEYLGLYWGIVAAILAGIAELIYYRLKDKIWDKFVIGSTFLIVFMGILSAIFNSPVYIMLKPVVMEGVFAVILFTVYFTGGNMINDLIRKQTRGMEIPEEKKKHLKGVIFRMAVMFFLHTGVLAYTVAYYGKREWLFVKGVLFYVFFAVLMLFEFIYARYFLPKKRQAHEEMLYYSFLNDESGFPPEPDEYKQNEDFKKN